MPTHLTTAPHSAVHYGVHEIALQTGPEFGNPYFEVELQLTFTRPDGSRVTVDGFYDGGHTFKARAYCDQPGQWTWRSQSNRPDLSDLSGAFQVIPSRLKGKLQRDADDPRQFAYHNGEWFLHLGDTGYRYLTPSEPNWRAYLEQAATAGVTKIRTWFCQDRSDVQILAQSNRQHLNLPYWQAMEQRLVYALNHLPNLILQLIPYGEDRAEVLRYGQGDPLAYLIARYAQARFSAFPNIHWCIANDFPLAGDPRMPVAIPGQPGVDQAQELIASIDRIGRDMAAREPWGTLLTNHQQRFSGYHFTDAAWSDIITLEDLGQVTGAAVLTHRELAAQPVVLDEDRYEHWRGPQHPRYFFRRLFWATLLSGGHPTYGGTRTFEIYDGGLSGLYGYYDACRAGKLASGADDFINIHEFFRESGLSLLGWTPDDSLSGNQPLLAKSMRGPEDFNFLIYLANPDVYEGHRPDRFGGHYTDEIARPASTRPIAKLTLPPRSFLLRWFEPSGAIWTFAEPIGGGQVSLVPPYGGDWVAWISIA